MEHRPENPVASQDPNGGLAVSVEGGAASVSKIRPTFTYTFSGSKPKHKVGQVAAVQQLPHLYLCETAGPPSGGQEAPTNTTKMIYNYLATHDIYSTFGVPAANYDVTVGIYDLIYNGAADTNTGTCVQNNFQNSCIQGPSSELGVAVIDACGRVVGDDTFYDLAPAQGDVCSDIDCAPGYYCDKSGADIGICKLPSEVVWSGPGNNRSTYPGITCSGSTCSSPPQCGVDADCANDVSTVASCSGQSVGCTAGGVAGANIGPTSGVSYTIGAGHSVDCLTNAQKSSHQTYTNPPASAACQFTDTQGSACSFVDTVSNVHNRHSTPGHSPQEVCPPIGSQYDWANGTDSTSCSDFDSATGCSGTIGMNCSPAGAVQYCNDTQGATESYSWSSTNIGTCTTTTGSCSSTVDFVTYGEATVGDCIAAAGGNTTSFTCDTSRVFDQYCDTSLANHYFCTCLGVWTPGGSSCGSSVGSCSSEITAAKCDSPGEVGDQIVCDDGTNIIRYTCQRSCNVPTKECALANTTPPWVDHTNSVNVTFSGQCNVQYGTCAAPTRDKANAGPGNVVCPNLDPLDPICAGGSLSCASQQANYCSGITFTIGQCDGTTTTCSGGNAGTTTPNCDHLTGYTLLTGKTITECLADGYDSCLPASTECTGRNYSCAANVTCEANELNYSSMANCESVHGTAQCRALTSGQACGRGCHPNVAQKGSTEAACNGAGNHSCVQIHGAISGVNNWCATACDSSAGAVTHTNSSDCTGTCPDKVVASSTSTPNYQPTTVYCEAGCDPTEFNTKAACEAANFVDGCKSIPGGKWVKDCSVVPTTSCDSGEVEYSSMSACTSSATGCYSQTRINQGWATDGVATNTGACPAEYQGGTDKGNCIYSDGTKDFTTPTDNEGQIPVKSCSAGLEATCFHCATGNIDFIRKEFTCASTSSTFYCGVPNPPSTGACEEWQDGKTFDFDGYVIHSELKNAYDGIITVAECKETCETKCTEGNYEYCGMLRQVHTGVNYVCSCGAMTTPPTVTSYPNNPGMFKAYTTCDVNPSGKTWQLFAYGCFPNDADNPTCNDSQEGQPCTEAEASSGAQCGTKNTGCGAAILCNDETEGPNCGKIFRCL